MAVKRRQRHASHHATLALRFTDSQIARILSDEALLDLLMPVLGSKGSNAAAFDALEKAVTPIVQVRSFRSEPPEVEVLKVIPETGLSLLSILLRGTLVEPKREGMKGGNTVGRALQPT